LQVAGCTGAEVAPPEDWAAGCHALVLDVGSCGILRLVARLVECLPETVAEQVGLLSRQAVAGMYKNHSICQNKLSGYEDILSACST